MPIRNFFILVLRIFGLLIIDDLLVGLLNLSSTLISKEFFINSTFSDVFEVALIPLFLLFIVGYLTYLLILKSSFVVDILKLDKGFEGESLTINIHRSDVLRISTIIIGGLVLVESVPLLFKSIVEYFEIRSGKFGMMKPSLTAIVFSSVKTIMGYLLLYYNRLIVLYIEMQRKRR